MASPSEPSVIFRVTPPTPTREIEISPHPDPHQNLPNTSVVDFDSVATINSWTRLQKCPAKLCTAVLLYLLETVSYALEVYCIYAILFNEDGVVNMQAFKDEKRITYIVMFLASFLNLVGKLAMDGSLQRWLPFSAREWMQFFGKCQMHLTRPIRYVRILHYWHKKNKIIGKDFVHGDTVTKEEIVAVTEINKEELGAARDDLYESFIQGIPMTVLQCYLFTSSPLPLKVCNRRDGLRFLYMILKLVEGVKAAMVYEWRKRLYLNSLHVQSYLFTNGRFPVPDGFQDLVATVFQLLNHSTSVLARFFLICYVSEVHWALGVGCTLLLFIGSWALISISSAAILSTVENPPEGISLPASYPLDRWINVFTVKDTRFYDLTRSPLKTRGSSREVRFPLVFVQVLPFLITFMLLYFIVALFGEVLSGARWLPGGVNGTIFKELGNDTFCPHHNPSKNILDFYDYVSYLVHTSGVFFQVGFRPMDGFYHPFSFHWTLLYLQLITVLLYNYYQNRFLENLDSCYPVLLTCAFAKRIFTKISEVSQRDNSLKLYLLKRFLFLLSVDLESFDELYQEFQRLRTGREDMVKWWDSQILLELDKRDPARISHRHFEVDRPERDLAGIPISGELDDALRLMQADNTSLRLFMFCTRRLDRVLAVEVTSNRLARTFELLGMSRRNLCIEVMQGKTVQNEADRDLFEA